MRESGVLPVMGRNRAESFERYYLRQVAMGEGCNCAEQVLSQRELPTVERSEESLWSAVRARLARWRGRW